MDKYNVQLMDRALCGLDAIYAYLARTLRKPDVALKLAQQLEDEICSLETMPYRCPKRTAGAYAKSDYRQLFVKHYTVVYRIDDENKTVIVVTVRYTPSQF